MTNTNCVAFSLGYTNQLSELSTDHFLVLHIVEKDITSGGIDEVFFSHLLSNRFIRRTTVDKKKSILSNGTHKPTHRGWITG